MTKENIKNEKVKRSPTRLTRYFREEKSGKILSIIFSVLFPLVLVLCVELITFGSFTKLLTWLTTKPLVFVMDYLLMAALIAIFFFITGRMSVSTTIIGVFMLLVSVISKFKYMVNGVPVFPWDVLFLKDVGKIANFASVPSLNITIELTLIIGTLVLISFMVFMYFAGPKIKVKWYSVFPSIGIVIMLVAFIVSPSVRYDFFPKLKMDYLDMLIPGDNYHKLNGFIGGFTLNLSYSVKEKPEEYTAQNMEKLVKKYTTDNNKVIADSEKPNIVVVMSEAFFDVTRIEGLKFNINPVKNYHEISKQGISGQIAVPTFSGGTVRSEFEFLTSLTDTALVAGSLPYQQYINKNTSSIAWHLKEQGYKTVGVHSYNKNFYSRASTYPLMGFDEFIGIEDFESELVNNGPYLSDKVFTNEMIKQIEKAGDKPLFLYGISMENHGLYEDKYTDLKIDTKHPRYKTKENKNTIDNYVQGVKGADEALKQLVDYLEKETSRKTILVFFGDHLPYLGGNYSAYLETGFIDKADDWSVEDHRKIFSTDYLIWSNYKNLTPSKEYTATYKLAPKIFEIAGFPKPPLYNFLDEYDKHLIAAQANFGVDSQEQTIGIDGDVYKKYLNIHKLLSYDIITGKSYFDPDVRKKVVSKTH